MNSTRVLVAVSLLALGVTASAATFEDEVLSLEVPAGFQGPIRQSPSPDAVLVAYTKPHTGERGTLLQISTYELGSKLPKFTSAELGAAAEKYLLEFLTGVERRRSSFQASKPTRIMLNGVPAAQVTWKGVAQGARLHGTMYCVVIGSRVVSFHTQDFENAPAENTSEAIRAFESVKFKHAG